jgi:hypothetical protein
MDFGGGQDKNRMRGRLFQGFQQGIEGRSGEHMHFIDNIDFIAALVGREIYLIAQVPHIFDAGVGSGVDLDQVQEAPGVYRLAVIALPARVLSGIGVQAVDGFRQQAGGGRFAGAARAGKQIGMGSPPGS